MKKIRINLFIICLLGVLAEVCAQESTWREMPYFLKGYEKQYKKSPKEAALSWFKDARFGLFVHWGPASLYGQGEWGRDFLKELSITCKKAGLGLFIYYSVGLDWHHPYYIPNTMYDPARPHYAKTPEEYKYSKPEDFKHYMNFAKTQIMELCTMYGPIAGFWFDTVGGVYQYSDLFNIQEVYDMIHAIQPHALVVFKTGANGNEDFITGERHFGSLAPVFKSVGLPKKVQDAADYSWQNNKAKPAELNIPIQTLGWAYHSSSKQRQKSAKEVMDLLDYCAKVNANLLLNIGPRPDGSILEENVRVLKEVGRKLKKEGFPRLNTKDYMKYRDSAKQERPKEKENQTAN